MKTYTEEEVVSLLTNLADKIDKAYWPYIDLDNENKGHYILGEYLYSFISPPQEKERTYPFTFISLDAKIEWDELCNIIGVDFYKKAMVDAREIFEIPESICKQYNLI